MIIEDLAFDALINEADVNKMRILLSDIMFDKKTRGVGKSVSISFGRQDCTMFRKVMSATKQLNLDEAD